MQSKFSQPQLIAAILLEMARQAPGARVTQDQFEAVRAAADSVVKVSSSDDSGEASHV